MQNNKNDIRILTPERISLFQYLKEVWRYRSFILTLARHDLKSQYSQTALGIIWVIIKPLTVLLLFTLIFDKLIHIPNLKAPYVLFAFSGLTAWNYFSFLVGSGGYVLIANQQMMRKMYYPKMALVLAKVLVGLIEGAVSLLLMLLLMAIVQFPVSANVILLPFFILLNTITGFTIAIWLNALSIRFRDLQQFIPQVISFLIWLTPVFYPVSLIPPSYSFLLFFNPMAGIVQGYRFSILGESPPSLQYTYTFLIVLIFCAAGITYFVRAEDEMPEYI